jgi:hypothetical protein
VDEVEDGSVDESASAKATAGLAVKVPPPCKDYALAMSAFDSDVVGAKSRNTLALQENLGGGKLPSWVNLPYSVAVPFGAMERVLDLPDNAEAKAELEVRQHPMNLIWASLQQTSALSVPGKWSGCRYEGSSHPTSPSSDCCVSSSCVGQERIAAIDTSSEEALADSLRECREVVKFLELPEALQKELSAAMKDSGMYVPQDAEDWFRAHAALRGVWASKVRVKPQVSPTPSHPPRPSPPVPVALMCRLAVVEDQAP